MILGGQSQAGDPIIVGYFVEWSVYDRNYHVADIPANKLTHVNYAFAQIVNGECTLVDSNAAIEKEAPVDKKGSAAPRGNFAQLRVMKKKYPHIKSLISIGGWTLSGSFSDVALTEEARDKFAKSCLAFIKKYGFDGVDIDWEYPVGGGKKGNKARPEDKVNYTLLLSTLRKRLDEAGKADETHYLLTIAAPTGPSTISHFELGKIHPYLDWINVMAYDFHGTWDATTHFNAPLYAIKDDPAQDEASRRLNVDAAIQTYLAAKVPPGKIVLGVSFTGRGWGGVKKINNGLFQPMKTIPKGTWEEGVFDYKDIAANYLGRVTRYWNVEAEVPWLYDERSGIMISYDDPQSLLAKARYAREKQLGGIMIWELNADNSKQSLLNAVREGLKRE